MTALIPISHCPVWVLNRQRKSLWVVNDYGTSQDASTACLLKQKALCWTLLFRLKMLDVKAMGAIQKVFCVILCKAVSSAPRFWQSLNPPTHHQLSSISLNIPRHTFPIFFFSFSAEHLFISVAASRRLHAWGHIQLAIQRSLFRLRETLFMELPGVGNQSPLLPIRGEGHTLIHKQSLVGFFCTSRAQCMWMIGYCYSALAFRKDNDLMF